MESKSGQKNIKICMLGMQLGNNRGTVYYLKLINIPSTHNRAGSVRNAKINSVSYGDSAAFCDYKCNIIFAN